MLLTFKGRWNAVTNTSTLVDGGIITNALQDGVGVNGDCYIIYCDNPPIHANIYNRDLGSGNTSWIALSYIYYDSSKGAWNMTGTPGSSGGGGTGTVTSIATTAPITGGTITTTGTIGITQSNTTGNGYLSSIDWNTFNNKVSTTRAINTTTPLQGGGDLSANRTLSITQASTSGNGYLSQSDWNTFNSKQAAFTGTGFVKSTSGVVSYDNSTYTPTSRILTINSVSFDLSADRSWVISASPSGSTTQIQYNNAGNFAGATNATISADGNIVLISTSGNTSGATTAPTSGSTKIYSNNRTGVDEIRVYQGLGGEVPLQNSMGNKIVGMLIPGNANINALFNWAGLISVTGTAANVGKAYDASNLLPNYTTVKYTSTAAINSGSEFYLNSSIRGVMVGNSINGGGSKLVITFGLHSYKSDMRWYVGYNATFASVTGVGEPSAHVNCLWVGKDSGDTTLQFMYNDASGFCTKTAIPVVPNVNDVYRVTIFIPSNSTAFYMTLESMNKTSIISYSSGPLTTNVPPVGTILGSHLAVGTGPTTTTAVTVGLIQMYEEQY
jgi:hypothetical protein